MSPERQQFIDKLKVRNYSQQTIRSYITALVKLAKHYNKSPLKMSTSEIEQYLLYETEVNKLGPATINQYIGCFKLFFKLMVPEIPVMQSIKKQKLRSKLPVVLTIEEVMKLIQCTQNIKHRAIIELLYSSGLRISEIINLRIRDVNMKDLLVYVTNGKGGKDRYSIIGKHASQTLQVYFNRYCPREFVFESITLNGKQQYSSQSIQKIFKKATTKANITKNVTPHTLRHSFATHLCEQNINLRTIQKLLGHSNINTTTIYTQVSNALISKIYSPLDIAFETTKEALS